MGLNFNFLCILSNIAANLKRMIRSVYLILAAFAALASAQSFEAGSGVKGRWAEFRDEGKTAKPETGVNPFIKTTGLPATGITGDLYLRTSFFGTSLSISTLFLSKDGIIVRDAKHGVDPLDLEKEKQDNSYNSGTYTIRDGKMDIRWNDGKSVSWRVEYKNGVMSGLDGGVVTLQKKMPSGYKLNGRFAALGVTANASSSQSYTFNEDGTFGLKSTAAVDNGEETGKSTDHKNGRYTVSGNTLTLHFNNGQTTHSVICIHTLGGKKHLIINRGSYPQE